MQIVLLKLAVGNPSYISLYEIYQSYLIIRVIFDAVMPL